MERVCDAAESGGDSICVCHPSTPSSSLSGVEREHGLLGALQLGIAAYLLWWLRRQQRKAVSAETAGSSLLVLPVYARFLKFEAWQCVVWGIFFFWSSYYDVSRQVPRGVIVLTQVARYVTSFTWALCGEGVFLFLCLDSAGIESLHTAVRLAAAWACALVGGCSFLWLSWAGCTAPPDDSWVLQALWVGAWVPYWMRLFLMPLFYGPALLLLSMPHRRAVARERGSLLLCVYNLATSALYLAPKVLFGVFGDAAGDDTAETWLLGDAVSMPLAWLLYVPFLAHVLQRDSNPNPNPNSNPNPNPELNGTCVFTSSVSFHSIGSATNQRMSDSPELIRILKLLI